MIMNWIQRYTAGVLLTMLCCMAAQADDHTHFMGLSLGMQPVQMMAELQDKGLRMKDSCLLTGRVAGVDVQLLMNCSRDTSSINHLRLTTRHLAGRNQRDDYAALMTWMRHHYGAPTWESTVRGHAFARWYVGFDRDIVMIASAPSAVDVWFYDNHKVRNIDYYSILKYCERNPSDAVPYLTARECVTWRSTTPPASVRKVAKGKGRHKVVRKTLHARRPVKGHAKTKGKSRRRRR